ncbi:MAG: protein kinase [Gemmatimonadetes bacterium]|nr:protein kinase [Gemmatimonadota bacterium]
MTDQFTRLIAALADRYAITEEIGAGGMATVYLAQDLKHHRQVAVKVLRPELASVLGAERFLKEIEVTANLQHPHIVALFDSGEADTFLILCHAIRGGRVAARPFEPGAAAAD